MCSIAGFIAEKPIHPQSAQSLTTALLYYGSERGEQSSGVAINGRVLKRAMDPDTFTALGEYDALFKERVSSALIHTRQPTMGGLGDEQAQPFKIGHAITIHNGWYTNCPELKNRWNIQKKSGVDSHLVTSYINSYGIRKLPSFIKTASGSSAIAALYRNELYLIRSGNPIAFTYLDLNDGNSLFIFASTARILSYAMRNVYLVPADHPIKELKEGVLFHVNTKRAAKMSEKVEHRRTFFQSTIGGAYRGYLEVGNAGKDDDYGRWWEGHGTWGDEFEGNEGEDMYDSEEDKPSDIKYFTPNKETSTTD